MVQPLSEFAPVSDFPGIYCAQRGTLRVTAIKLKRGGLCLFSPVQGLTEARQDQLFSLGEVRFLLAPNFYHNKAIVEYADAFSNAAVIAPAGAHERLTRITGLAFADLSELRTQLPSSVSLKPTVGLKTGELWIKIRKNARTAWIVVDAFSGSVKSAGSSESETPELLGTFPRMGIQDKKSYVSWVNKQLVLDQPTVMIPCHGALIRAADLPTRLSLLLDRL